MAVEVAPSYVNRLPAGEAPILLGSPAAAPAHNEGRSAGAVFDPSGRLVSIHGAAGFVLRVRAGFEEATAWPTQADPAEAAPAEPTQADPEADSRPSVMAKLGAFVAERTIAFNEVSDRAEQAMRGIIQKDHRETLRSLFGRVGSIGKVAVGAVASAPKAAVAAGRATRIDFVAGREATYRVGSGASGAERSRAVAEKRAELIQQGEEARARRRAWWAARRDGFVQGVTYVAAQAKEVPAKAGHTAYNTGVYAKHETTALLKEDMHRYTGYIAATLMGLGEHGNKLQSVANAHKEDAKTHHAKARRQA